ncbi:50S ribosomal protein L5 [Candidatus Saccharibacteria bacterium]|nr:50S ribosomal protein L5 [Candidatus Saccharibacteria bacterium]MCL1962677.1 50S ribosomal protein L5 [Candidatus Saccharibacteria bacterium]
MAEVKKKTVAVTPSKAEESKKDSSTSARNDKKPVATAKYTPRLKALYRTKIVPELLKELDAKNVHQLPRLTKIVVSSGTGRNKENKSYQAAVLNTLTRITGQKPVARLAKKSIATFKIRAKMGAPVGVNVTLRGEKMFEFLDRLINVAMPRIRDFHGVSAKAFDKNGNYNLGLLEQSIFPELTFEETAILHGLQVTFAIQNGAPESSRKLLEKFGIPFEKEAK